MSKISPLAVLWPWNPGPYHEAIPFWPDPGSQGRPTLVDLHPPPATSTRMPATIDHLTGSPSLARSVETHRCLRCATEVESSIGVESCRLNSGVFRSDGVEALQHRLDKRIEKLGDLLRSSAYMAVGSRTSAMSLSESLKSGSAAIFWMRSLSPPRAIDSWTFILNTRSLS